MTPILIPSLIPIPTLIPILSLILPPIPRPAGGRRAFDQASRR